MNEDVKIRVYKDDIELFKAKNDGYIKYRKVSRLKYYFGLMSELGL